MKVKLLYPDSKLPVYATPGSACFDLHAHVSVPIPFNAGSQWVIGTGLSVEVPEGYVLLLFSRSGHAAKHGMRLGNCVGVIDSDYRGEVSIILTMDDNLGLDNVVEIRPGDRIAQGMLVPIPKVSFTIVDEVSPTTRGAGGFGSTGG